MREQDERFRKPLDSQAAESGSDAEPVKARIEADGGDEELTLEVAEKHCEWLRQPERSECLTVVARMLLTMQDEVRRLREIEIRFKLDEAGIASREKDAVELVELRAEVRRLREELEIERGRHGHTESVRAWAQSEREKLSAKLARVEALPATLRARGRDIGDARLSAEIELICERIARALRDEPQPEREPKLPYKGY